MLKLNRWAVLYWGITLSFVLLITIPEENFVFRSVSITLIAVFSICYYLYKRYSERLSVQADLLISINTLVQFLLPVFYLAFYYQANPDLDPWNHRYGYAVTSFAALLGQTMFFLGYESVKKSIYFPRIQIIESSYSRLFLVLLPLLMLIWISRFVLLSTGSYYKIHITSYQFTSPFYSVFAQLSGYGLIIVGALFLIAFSEQGKRERNKKFLIAFTLFILEMLWYVPSGAREYIVFTLAAPILAYIFISRTVPKKIIVLMIIAGIPLLAGLGVYRYVAFDMYQVSKIDLKTTPAALLMARERLKHQNINMIANITDRMYDGKSLGYLLMHYSDDYDYELGSTYKNMPFVFIPRFVYPDKPVFTTALNNWYTLLAGGSMPTTFWGEAYINFSWLGIIFCSYILGLLMKGFDYLFIKRTHKPYWMYLYLFSAIYIARLPMQVAVVWVALLLKLIILALILTGMHTSLTRVARGDSSIHFVANSTKKAI